ncbi:hypothetical protein GGR56DRAFT_643479 [Xylariaceae sp. FL0804]|nr:hypothetical protein GGR56DRAFT_643479 [Xylariaceae sp. FL0804]
MVSLWPWKGDGSSPASFEKTLSTLSTKITSTQTQLDRVRSNSRRIRVLWTLYLAFAYLVYAIVLMLVVGWQNLGAWEWTGVAGGPVLIYIIRTGTNTYYGFRMEKLESRLKDQQAERAKTIQKLKDATRFDSTQELLKKYGGSGEKRTKGKNQDGEGNEGETPGKKRPGKKRQPSNNPSGWTNLPPPPTANIVRPQPKSGTAPDRQGPRQPPPPQAPSPEEPTAEFAPNAGHIAFPPAQYEAAPGGPRWYDRLMDLMLGEDETTPKNRIVLICSKCRLVNGQAPPGTKDLAEIGTWKCMGCGATNGEMDEGKRIMREVLGGRDGPASEHEGGEDGSGSDESSGMVKIEQEDDRINDSEHSPVGSHSGPRQRKR